MGEVVLDAVTKIVHCELRLFIKLAFRESIIQAKLELKLAKRFLFACSDVANLHAWREQVWIEHDRPCECLRFCQACSNMDASKRFQRDFTVVRADHARPGRAGNCVIRVGIDLTAEK